MTGVCECGCGGTTNLAPKTIAARGYVKGKPYRFIMGHNQRLKSAGHSNYFRFAVPGGQRLVHVEIAERVLGRPLPAGAEVHHVDGNRQNNAHSNLVICQDHAYHFMLHARARVVKAGGNPNTQKFCCACHQLKSLDAFNARKAHSSGRQNICRECAKAAFRAWEQRRKGRAA